MGGAQQQYDFRTDLSTLGKIFGEGLPVNAYGGTKEIMQMVAPSGPFYQAGTLSSNPLAMAAGMTLSNFLKNIPSVYANLECSATMIGQQALKRTAANGVALTVNQVGSMFTLFFTSQPVTHAATARTSDNTLFRAFFRSMLGKGIYLPPSQYEAAFLSARHSEEDT